MSAVETGQMSSFETGQTSAVETGQMSAFETGQMSAAETGQMSAVETRQMLKSQIRGRAQNHQNDPKWVQNGRQDTRIGQNESYHGSGAFPTGPVAKNPPKKARTPEIDLFGPPLSGSTAQVSGERRRRVLGV